VKSTTALGIESVSLERRSGPVVLTRPDGKVGTLSQPGQPDRRIALHRRNTKDCLIEELRRLDPDEVYDAALRGLDKISGGTPERAKAARKSGNGKKITKTTTRASAK